MEWLWFLPIVILLSFSLTVLRGAPYVPTLKINLKQVFDDLYPLSSYDVLVDIGSGDGVVLREAARRGASAVGYEINPFLVFISRIISRKQPRVRVNLADFWLVNLPDATTVVYVFSVSRDIEKIARRIQKEANRLNKSIRLISCGFELKDIELVRKAGAHYLYTFTPSKKAKLYSQ
jgi:SAM-dependent methyltransferase